MTVPYHEDSGLLKRLQKKSREDRIKWHQRRVRKDQIVNRVIDHVKMNHIVEDAELLSKLMTVRREIVEIEKYVKLRENVRFQKLVKALESLVVNYTESAQKAHRTLIQWLQDSNQKSLNSLVARLQREEPIIELALSIELQLQDLCKEHEVDCRQFLRIAAALETFRGPQIQKIMKENMGYEK